VGEGVRGNKGVLPPDVKLSILSTASAGYLKVEVNLSLGKCYRRSNKSGLNILIAILTFKTNWFQIFKYTFVEITMYLSNCVFDLPRATLQDKAS